MEARGLTLAMVGCALLLGCGTMSTTGDGNPKKASSQQICDDGSKKCPIVVTLLSKCPTLNQCLGVDFEFVIAKKEKIKITWELATLDQRNYAFLDMKTDGKDGIDFGDSRADFSCKTAENGKSVVCENLQRNSVPTVYKYTINVKHVGWSPTTVDPLDPFVVNH